MRRAQTAHGFRCQWCGAWVYGLRAAQHAVSDPKVGPWFCARDRRWIAEHLPNVIGPLLPVAYYDGPHSLRPGGSE